MQEDINKKLNSKKSCYYVLKNAFTFRFLYTKYNS
jgi:hypothetical protein